VRKLRVWYQRRLPRCLGGWGDDAIGPWYRGPWPGRFRDVPAFAAADVLAAYQPAWAAGSIYARSDAASKANSLVNLNDPGTNDGTEVNTPGWTAALGWDLDFATAYPAAVDTGVVPQSPWGMLLCMGPSSDAYMAGFPAGSRNSGPIDRFSLSFGGGGFTYGYGSTLVAGENPTALEVVGVFNDTAYRGGLRVAAISPGLTGRPSHSVYVGGMNDAGSLQGGLLSVKAFHMFKWATAEQLAALTWAMLAIGGA